MFDKAEITVRAGDGGGGAISFRREKFVPRAGPDGGDGGQGGDVVVIADSSVSSLRMFRRKRLYRAADGGDGGNKKKKGKQGEDLILRVPPGTMLWDESSSSGKQLIADLQQDGQRSVVARGGRGGWGNLRFVSATNQAPKLAEKGEAGEEAAIALELRYIADVGIIGYPNAGKSTLLAAVSAAQPKVASYPFTTLEPVLGVVEVEQQRFVLAEIPGLIADAHLGRGLGLDFLRHAMRTRVLIHLIDGTSAHPVEDMLQVNKELGLFDAALAAKPQLVVVNKIDIPEVRARLAEIKQAFTDVGPAVRFLSAAQGEGISELIAAVGEMLGQIAVEVEAVQSVPVFRPQPRRGAVSVRKDGDTFVIIVPRLERIVARVDMTNPEVRWQLRGQIIKMGIQKALERAGVKPGDTVRCGDAIWEW